MEYSRFCPQCGNKLTYHNKSNLNSANSKESLCRDCSSTEGIKKGDLTVLLEDNPITYYWIGFLLADGYFAEKHIKVTLSYKDKEHLTKLKKFLKIEEMGISEKKGKGYCTIKTMDSKIVPIIRDKFNISNQKTYNPPKLEDIGTDDRLLLSLIVGFMDGDGCIRKKGKSFSLVVQVHGSWLNNLKLMASKINETTNPKLNKRGYAYFSITNHKSLKKLKRFVIKEKLPVLDRKWDKIDLNFIPHKEAHDRNFKTFEKMFEKFKKLSEEYDYYDEKFKKVINN